MTNVNIIRYKETKTIAEKWLNEFLENQVSKNQLYLQKLSGT